MNWGGRRDGAGRPAFVEAERAAEDRQREIRRALAYGPYALVAGEHVEQFSDDELRDAFEQWARDERDWPATTYAAQRFLHGLTRHAALIAMEAAEAREQDAWLLATVVEAQIRDPRNPIFGRLPAAYIEDLLRRARALQAPLVCWRCRTAICAPDASTCAACSGELERPWLDRPEWRWPPPVRRPSTFD